MKTTFTFFIAALGVSLFAGPEKSFGDPALFHEVSPPFVAHASRVGPNQILVAYVDGVLSTGVWSDEKMERSQPLFIPNAFTDCSAEWKLEINGKPMSLHRTVHLSLPEQALRNAPRRALRHLVLLQSASPLPDGVRVCVRPLSGGRPLAFTVSDNAPSALVQVPHQGWTPDSPDKHALMGAWFDPEISSDNWLNEDIPFAVLDATTRTPVPGWDFSDGHTLERTRRAGDVHPTAWNPANAWETRHDIYVARFPDLRQPGKYVVAVKGIGASPPFAIDSEVHRPLVRHLLRGFIHLQHGDDRRAEAVHPALVIPPTMRHMRFIPARRSFATISPDGVGDMGKLWQPSPIELEDDPQLKAFGIDHPTEGWRDAADFDIRPHHLEVAFEMLLFSMRFPRLENLPLGRAEEGEAYDKTIRSRRIRGSIPLSGITHTALYCGDAFTRLQVDTEGPWKNSVRGGFELRGYIGGNRDFQSFATRFKEEDVAYLLRPDPWATYAYASFAAAAALKMESIGEQILRAFYAERALAAWDWAAAHEDISDPRAWNPDWRQSRHFLDAKANAAVALWGLTGEARFHQAWAALPDHTQPIMRRGRHTSARAYLMIHQLGLQRGDPAKLAEIRNHAMAAFADVRQRALEAEEGSGLPLLFDRPLSALGHGDYGLSINHPYGVWWELFPSLLLLFGADTPFTSEDRQNLHRWIDAELNYLCGRNPHGRSFITGFGRDMPRAIHHNDWQGTGLSVPFPGLVPFGLLSHTRVRDVIDGSGYSPPVPEMPYHYRLVNGLGIHPNQGEFTPQNTLWQAVVAAVAADYIGSFKTSDADAASSKP